MNKEKELQILHYIYSSKSFEALSTEEPDFIVTNLATKQVFGVEITEFFLDECYARLKNIPHYIEEIITDKNYRNKGDKNKLPVHEVTINSHTQTPRNRNLIITDSPTKDELGLKIAALINNKDSKIVNYQKQAASLFLVIYDNQSCLNDNDPSKIHVSIYGLDLIRALLNSKFDKIFFITQSSDGKVYFELKEINIMALVFLTFAFAQGFKNIANEELLYIFLNLLSNIGMQFKIGFHDDYIQVVASNMEFRLTDEDGALKISELKTDFCDASFHSESFCPDEEYFNIMKDDYLNFLRNNGLQTNFHHKKANI